MKDTEAISRSSEKEGVRSVLAVIPGIGTAILPSLTCPACWPAYAGFLSSLGVGYFNYTPYLFPLTAIFLTLAVASLGFRAKSRRGFKPLLLGTIASAMVLAGKFLFNSNVLMYFGIALLMTASTWNAWPKRKKLVCLCPSIDSEEIDRKD